MHHRFVKYFILLIFVSLTRLKALLPRWTSCGRLSLRTNLFSSLFNSTQRFGFVHVVHVVNRPSLIIPFDFETMAESAEDNCTIQEPTSWSPCRSFTS